MAEIIPMTEEQKFKLEIYRLLSRSSSVAEEVFTLISADQLELESFKLYYNDDGASLNFTSHAAEAVHKSKEALDLLITGV